MTGAAEAIAFVVNRVAGSPTNRPFRIGIDGRSAAGKTTLAARLAKELTASCRRPLILAGIDGFHKSREERYARGRYSAEGYYEDGRDYAACREQLLVPLGPNGNRQYRTSSFDLDLNRSSTEPFRRAAEGAILLFEGDFLMRPEFSDCWDLLLLLHISSEEAAARGAERDAAKLGGYERALALHQRRYQPAFGLYEARCRTIERADIVVISEPAKPGADVRP